MESGLADKEQRVSKSAIVSSNSEEVVVPEKVSRSSINPTIPEDVDVDKTKEIENQQENKP